MVICRPTRHAASFSLICFACNAVENETPIIFLRHSLKIHNSQPMRSLGCLAAATLLYMAPNQHQCLFLWLRRVSACAHTHQHLSTCRYSTNHKISINLEFIFIFIFVDTIERCEIKRLFSHFMLILQIEIEQSRTRGGRLINFRIFCLR